MERYLLIALGGIAGANARFLISVWAAGRFGMAFPYGTFFINVSGSIVTGAFLTLVAGDFGNDPNARFVVATGFLGAYTTFSAFGYETLVLIRRGMLRSALINAFGSTALAVAGAGLGIALATTLGG